MLVKICGISNILDAHEAINAGASAVGFVMGGKCLPVEVEPHAQTVREIIKTFPKHIDSYVVTHLLNAKDILDLAEYVNSTGIQISEEIDLSIVKEIRNNTSKKIIKTVVARGNSQTDSHYKSIDFYIDSNIDRLKSYEPYSDYILLDSVIAGYVGGTGVTSDWHICKAMVEAASLPVFLAGGLNPDNVIDAIRSVRPEGVDVATGVSTFSEEYLRKDRKSPEKIHSFIQRARAVSL